MRRHFCQTYMHAFLKQALLSWLVYFYACSTSLHWTQQLKWSFLKPKSDRVTPRAPQLNAKCSPHDGSVRPSLSQPPATSALTLPVPPPACFASARGTLASQAPDLWFHIRAILCSLIFAWLAPSFLLDFCSNVTEAFPGHPAWTAIPAYSQILPFLLPSFSVLNTERHQHTLSVHVNLFLLSLPFLNRTSVNARLDLFLFTTISSMVPGTD